MSFSIQTKILVQRVNKKNLMWSREKTNLYVEDKLCEQKVWLNHYFQTKFAMANNANIPPPKSCLCIVALCFRHIIEQNFRNSRCKITFPVWVWETLLMPLLSDPTSSHETLWTFSELRESCHLSSRNKCSAPESPCLAEIQVNTYR